jgi:hypothetical protein
MRQVDTEWVHVQYREAASFQDTYGFNGSQGNVNLEGIRMRPAGQPSSTLVIFMHPAIRRASTSVASGSTRSCTTRTRCAS